MSKDNKASSTATIISSTSDKIDNIVHAKDEFSNVVQLKNNQKIVLKPIFNNILSQINMINENFVNSDLSKEDLYDLFYNLKYSYNEIQEILKNKNMPSIPIDAPIGWLPAGNYTKENLPKPPQEVLEMLSEIGFDDIDDIDDVSQNSTRLVVVSRKRTAVSLIRK